jgi:hypothetical protein
MAPASGPAVERPVDDRSSPARSPEVAAILRACARLRPGAGEREEEPSGPSEQALDWHVLVELASRTSVLPVLAETLDPLVAATPDWVGRILTGASEGSRLKTRVLLRAAEEIAVGLDGRSIPGAFRKGAHLCGLYPSIATRPFTDLDLYVRREDLRSTLEVLAELGFEPYLTRTEEIFFSLATESNTSRVRRTGLTNVYVDLSTQVGLPRLTRAADTDGHELLDAMLERRQVSPEGVPVLSAEDLLIDVIVNFYVANTTLRNIWEGRHQRLRAYTDVLVADRACPATSAGAVASAMRASSLDHMAAYTRQSLADVFPGEHIGSLDFAAALTTTAHRQVGQLDLPDPYLWNQPHVERVFAAGLPPDLPPSTLPASHG